VARSGPAPGPSEALEEARHGDRRVDLDDPVEIADVDAQLERARGDDDAVAGLGKRRLGAPPLVQPQRAVRDERRYTGPSMTAAAFFSVPTKSTDRSGGARDSRAGWMTRAGPEALPLNQASSSSGLPIVADNPTR
jgi:hypothetical protein